MELANGEPKIKKVGEHAYHWYKHHKIWSAHTEAKCKKSKANFNATNNFNSNLSLTIVAPHNLDDFVGPF